MQQRETVILRRDCEGILVPSGDKIILRKGQEAIITQALGGSYTVIVMGNLARIDGKCADALGKEVEAAKKYKPSTRTAEEVDEQLIWEKLATCYDPEIPVNIVELGLIYDLKITPLKDDTGQQVDIKMTLTAPGCGMGPFIAEDARQKVLSVPGVVEASVQLVWEPQWNQNMMSEAARLKLGML
ncbi:MAG: putative Fe-S cluster assembly protein SufT [Fidelibacterota bacterium]|nr:MAG: putative Fe-S cluster assembly protein SufT [Candidatus Neomarinimicrobiota bacterium]